tara:strand:+ start:455 stop:946 length:492 start_codon:yes stop_codon:yes gene_type:complete
MLLIVSLTIAFIMIVVLFYKFIGVERGVDKNKENVNAVVIGKEPYVTPSIDVEIQEQMKTLQQMYIPVQYIDNGLMPKIQTSISKGSEVEKILKSQKYKGPAAFSHHDLSSSAFQEAKFKDSLKNFEPDVPNAAIDVVDEIEPFNSFFGMVASEGQTVSSFDP